MNSLEGRVAVIAGASYGIGRAVAIGLAREGCDLILVARGEEGLEETAQRVSSEGRKAIICNADLGIPSDIKRIAEVANKSFGKVDILWNGAFGWIDGPIEDMDDESLMYFLDASLKGPLLLVKALMPSLLMSKHAHIINIVTDWEFSEQKKLTAFIAAKRALAGMGIALAKEMQGRVRVTNLYPALVASEDHDIDDPIQQVIEETGCAQIPLKDIVDITIALLKLESTTVHQIYLKPTNHKVEMSFAL